MITFDEIEKNLQPVKEDFEKQFSPLKASIYYASIWKGLEEVSRKSHGVLEKHQLINELAERLNEFSTASQYSAKDVGVLTTTLKKFAAGYGVESKVEEKISEIKRPAYLTDEVIAKRKKVGENIWKVQELNVTRYGKHGKIFEHDVKASFTYVNGVTIFKARDANFDMVTMLANGLLGLKPVEKAQDGDIGLAIDCLIKEYGIDAQVNTRYRELNQAQNAQQKH